MINLDITKLAAFWGKAPLEIKPSQCLPLRSPKSTCRLCVADCPTEAIQIKDDSVAVTDNKCTGCGVCFNVCPTEVFKMTNFSPDAFIEKAQSYIANDRVVKIECYKIPLHCAAPQSLRLPCLAHITTSLILRLLSLGADKVIVRDGGICEVCESRCGDKIANDAITKVHEILKQLDLKKNAFMADEGVSINNLTFDGEKLKDFKDDPEMSRREIFSIFKNDAVKGVKNIIKGNSSPGINRREIRSKKDMPEERRLLVSAFKKIAVLIPEGGKSDICSKLFPAVSIKNGCDFCGLCALFCPTDALAMNDTEKGQGIIFNAVACTWCNICTDVCGKGVLTIEKDRIQLADILEHKKKTLIWKEKSFCEDCGKLFIRKDSENYCDACLKEREI